MLMYRSVYAQKILTNVLVMRKLLHFEQKNRRRATVQELFNVIDDVPKITQRVHNWWQIMGVRLWLRKQSPIIPMKVVRIASMIEKTLQVRSCEGLVWFLPEDCWVRHTNEQKCEKKKSWIFQHNKTKQKQIAVFTGPGPPELFPFPKLETPMKEKRFASIEQTKENRKRISSWY